LCNLYRILQDTVLFIHADIVKTNYIVSQTVLNAIYHTMKFVLIAEENVYQNITTIVFSKK